MICERVWGAVGRGHGVSSGHFVVPTGKNDDNAFRCLQARADITLVYGANHLIIFWCSG